MTSQNRPPKIERRARKRAAARIDLSLDVDGTVTRVSTTDISSAGLSCCLPAPLRIYTKYGFRLFVPVGDGKTKEIDGEGIVVRVEEVEVDGDAQFQTAFFFQNLDVKHQQLLESVLHSGEDSE